MYLLIFIVRVKQMLLMNKALRIISKTDVCDEIHLEALAQPVFLLKNI